MSKGRMFFQVVVLGVRGSDGHNGIGWVLEPAPNATQAPSTKLWPLKWPAPCVNFFLLGASRARAQSVSRKSASYHHLPFTPHNDTL